MAKMEELKQITQLGYLDEEWGSEIYIKKNMNYGYNGDHESMWSSNHNQQLSPI